MIPAPTFWQVFNAALAPVHFESLVEFSERFAILPECLTISGKFSCAISPHFRAPMDALDKERVRKVVVGKPVRGGGSLIADLWHLRNLAREPGPSMMVFNDGRVSKEHCLSRYVPMLAACELTRGLLPNDAKRMSHETLQFNNGTLWYVSGPAIGRLQAKGVRYLSLDEVWMYENTVLPQAFARLGDFQRMGLDKTLITSQAGDEGDAFDSEFHSGKVHEWCPPCPQCGHVAIVRWINFRPDSTIWGVKWTEHKDAGGMHEPEKSADTVRFECGKCGAESDEDRCKTAWRTGARYVSESDGIDSATESYRWTAIIDFPWRLLVKEFLHAKNKARAGDLGPLVEFYRKRMVEPKNEAGVIEANDNFVRETYDISSTWSDEKLKILTADRQGEDVFWVSVRAWSAAGESRRLHFSKAFGFAELEDLRERFKLHPKQCFIDSGFMAKGERGVYAFCIIKGWVPLKGVAEMGGGPKLFFHTIRQRENGKLVSKRVPRDYSEPVPVDPDCIIGGAKRFAQLINFSSPTMSDHVDRLVTSGLWVEPAGAVEGDLEREYRKQMSGEIKVRTRHHITRVERSFWRKVRRDNHAFDLAKMQCLGAALHGIDLHGGAGETKEEPEPETQEATT